MGVGPKNVGRCEVGVKKYMGDGVGGRFTLKKGGIFVPLTGRR